MGKEEILDLYDEKLKELDIEYKSFYVKTSFGKTHIITTGDVSNPPLVLVHGSNACAPIALECYPNLSSTYQVFCIDVLAQPNKSEGTRLNMKDDSYSKWMNEVISGLRINNVVIAGFSFGGLIILKTLAHNPERIKEAFLASPAYIVNGNPLKALFKVFIPIKLYMNTRKIKYVEKFLATIFTEKDEFAVKFLSKAFLYFNMDFTSVPVISEKEAKKIKTPITLIGAKNDVLFPGTRMIKRAKKLLPFLKQVHLLEESKHVQNEEGNLIVEKLILKSKIS
ncbi:alpha/beta fold hydrolase [Maribacter sp. 2210JD10-5]|uniref:alpha/beta fold hydrolase n=1 Tax=Maribacter sp. 2210JD10-5 TaxID=3386272 RepID=UPI0039BC762A